VATESPKSLFPYFGGKSKIAPIIWERIGPVRNYVEPFVGSGAVFFQKPHDSISTLNDSSGLMINLWRGIQRNHEAVASEAAKLLGEADLHAVELEAFAKMEELKEKCEADPGYFNPTLAGRYLWGLCNKIGSFATETGPWINYEGKLTDRRKLEGEQPRGICRKLPHLGGMGICRKLPHASDREEYILGLMAYYVDRLQRARITCGDWARVCKSKSVTTVHGLTGIFLDPPYEDAGVAIKKGLYADNGCFWDVVEWAKSEEANSDLRLAVAGYHTDELEAKLEGWEMVRWKQRGGYGTAKNSAREVVFFSPQCLKAKPFELM